DRIEGGIFIVMIIAYNFIAIYFSRKENQSQAAREAKEAANPERKLFFDILFIIGGIIILVAGANLFLHGATDLAKIFGASDAVIGLTVVAFGTSLPELATSVVAAVKKEGDISIGNAIGSNIYNILLIIGATALISPITITGIKNTDIGMLIFISLLILPLAGFGLKLNRPKGVLLLSLYAGYMFYLFQ
ncbi:MAG: sodium:calcium antiporter, partial [Candidatus Kapaibacterium sp.]